MLSSVGLWLMLTTTYICYGSDFLSVLCTKLLCNVIVIPGEGFPLWSAGMAAMYATEIVTNHFMVDFTSTLMMDMHADSSLSTQEVGKHLHLK